MTGELIALDSNLPAWLWPIALFGGIGAFIDFVIGRVGQERARGFLETWWIRFDDVRWNDFGRKEATFAVTVFDSCFGRRFFSTKRMIWISSFFMFTLAYVVAMMMFNYFYYHYFYYLYLPLIPELIAAAIGLSLSISLTRNTAAMFARSSKNNRLINFGIAAATLFITYVLLCVWTPITQASQSVLQQVSSMMIYGRIEIEGQTISPSQLINNWQVFFNQIPLMLDISPNYLLARIKYQYITFATNYIANVDQFVLIITSYLANTARLCIAIIFFGSFLFQSVLIPPTSLVWRRLVESDKPIFTLIFGGFASVATFANELAKHLST